MRSKIGHEVAHVCAHTKKTSMQCHVELDSSLENGDIPYLMTLLYLSHVM